MGKLGQPTTVKPTISKRAATSLTKSCAYTSCTSSTYPCCYPSSYCTLIFYFIRGVSQDDDPSKYAIPTGDQSFNSESDKSNGADDREMTGSEF